MNHSSKSQSIAWFQEQYKAGRLTLRPPFQRKPVWSAKQRAALIESILLNIPIPEIYVQVSVDDEGDQQFGVVDGQQRLRTILQFVGIETGADQIDEEDNNRFALEELPDKSKHKGRTFADVKGDERKAFFQYEICVRYLYTSDDHVVEDVFKRLNRFLLPLKPQELRNATYHGPFAKLSEELANEEYWAVNRIVSPASIRRMGDIEMMSDLLIGLLHGPQGGSSKVIDEYYENYEPYDKKFPGQIKVRKIFSVSLSNIEFLFSDISVDGRWGNRADFYSLFVALGHTAKGKKLQKSARSGLTTALTDLGNGVSRYLDKRSSAVSENAKNYALAIEKGSNDRARRMVRHEILVSLIEKAMA